MDFRLDDLSSAGSAPHRQVLARLGSRCSAPRCLSPCCCSWAERTRKTPTIGRQQGALFRGTRIVSAITLARLAALLAPPWLQFAVVPEELATLRAAASLRRDPQAQISPACARRCNKPSVIVTAKASSSAVVLSSLATFAATLDARLISDTPGRVTFAKEMPHANCRGLMMPAEAATLQVCGTARRCRTAMSYSYWTSNATVILSSLRPTIPHPGE